jgi:IS1 family transposase
LAFHQWKKNKVWLWRAIDGVTRHPLGGQVGHHGDSTLKKLLAKLDMRTCFFITDEWPGFFRLLPQVRHFYGKDLTFPTD